MQNYSCLIYVYKEPNKLMKIVYYILFIMMMDMHTLLIHKLFQVESPNTFFSGRVSEEDDRIS